MTLSRHQPVATSHDRFDIAGTGHAVGSWTSIALFRSTALRMVRRYCPNISWISIRLWSVPSATLTSWPFASSLSIRTFCLVIRRLPSAIWCCTLPSRSKLDPNLSSSSSNNFRSDARRAGLCSTRSLSKKLRGVEITNKLGHITHD